MLKISNTCREAEDVVRYSDPCREAEVIPHGSDACREAEDTPRRSVACREADGVHGTWIPAGRQMLFRASRVVVRGRSDPGGETVGWKGGYRHRGPSLKCWVSTVSQ